MSSHAPRILLIEAEPVLAELTSFRLELLGYQVHTTRSTGEAFEAIYREVPDAIILDPALPGAEGTELINRLRDDELTTGVPILVLSCNADSDDVRRTYAAGANDYLVVPYDPLVLEERLEALLHSSEPRPEATTSSPRPACVE